MDGPGGAAIGGGENAGWICSAGCDPGALSTLSGDTRAAGGELRFSGEGRRKIVADVMPRCTVGGAEIGEASVDGVADGDAAFGCPEGEAIVKGVGIVILELKRPVGAAVGRLVNAGVSAVADGEKISDLVAEGLDVAELKSFRAG